MFAAFDGSYSTWLQVVKIVSELDCLLSLSKSSAALGEPSVRPEIVESDAAIIEFEELRHPCILRLVFILFLFATFLIQCFSATNDFIPNDVALGGDSEQMILLTGPNVCSFISNLVHH